MNLINLTYAIGILLAAIFIARRAFKNLDEEEK